MANTIKHKRGSGSNPSASDLVAGEIAVRTDTGVLFTKKDDGSVAQIAGGGGTNLGVTTASGSVTVTSDTGNNATISEASSSAAGVMSTAHHDKLDGIEANATADQSASEILTAIKTVDGTGSGLDADTLDGVEGSSFLRSDAADTKTSGNLTFNDNVTARFGSSGDLEIYHDGSNSYIDDVGTGELRIRVAGTGGSGFYKYNNNEKLATFEPDGPVTLYHNNSSKLETSSSGISVTGNVVVSGTVDGRDVASDGSKLDGIAAGAEVNVGTNLSRTTTASANTIVSSTGNNVTLTEATNSAAGLMTTAHHSKLDGIESGATADQSASEILTAIKTVDGSGSGLDADLLDGVQGSSFLRSDTSDSASGTHTFDDLRADGGNLILGDDAYSTSVNYVGMKTAFQSGSNDYMIISGLADGHTYVSAKDGSSVHIRGGGNNSTNQIVVPDGGAPTIGGNTIWHAGNDGSGSGLDADTVDGISSASFLRSDAADTAGQNITFSAGGGAATIAGNSDIRFNNGNWTGDYAGKIQQHGNWLYLMGGSNGIVLRSGGGTDRAYIDSSGNFRPAQNNVYDLGTSSAQWRDGFFDGTVNADGLDIDGNGDISGSLTLHGNLDLQDNDYILVGAGDDLQIHHNASDSYITNATGELVVINYANDEDIVLATDDSSGGITDYLRCDGGDGSVRAYYYGTQKFQTKSFGIDVAGNINLSASSPKVVFGSDAEILVPSSNTLDFLTNGTHRLKITSAGDVRVRNFSPRIGASLSSVSSNFSAYFAAQGTGGGNIPIIVERYNDNGVCIEFKRNTSVVGNINVTSTTTNYVESSDYRLKENVVNLDGAIDRVKQLAPKRFNFIIEPDTTVDGFLAHEAQTVVPEAVTGTHNEVQVWDANDQANGDLPDGVSVGDNKLDEDGNTIPVYQGIDLGKLVPLLTAALQEAITKIETLEAKVAALESA